MAATLLNIGSRTTVRRKLATLIEQGTVLVRFVGVRSCDSEPRHFIQWHSRPDVPMTTAPRSSALQSLLEPTNSLHWL